MLYMCVYVFVCVCVCVCEERKTSEKNEGEKDRRRRHRIIPIFGKKFGFSDTLRFVNDTFRKVEKYMYFEKIISFLNKK